MALKLTRQAGSKIYGGMHLDPDDLESSCQHRIWVRWVRDDGTANALVHIKSASGVSERLVEVGGEPVRLCEGISFTLESVYNYTMKATPYCVECQRGGSAKEIIPQASFAFNAPRVYQIVRDDAVTRSKK
jgi:hypothetical protein